MTELQKNLTIMLSDFHDLCEKYGLRYYVVSGTMLGAVRHKGFIPWDDDIDVGMPRVDYEKLRQIAQTEKFGKYAIEYPSKDNKEYSCLWAKMYNTETTMIEKQRYPIKRGIYIDIFPLDGMGDSLEEAEKDYKVFFRNYKLYYVIIGAFLKRRSFVKNAAVLVGRIISPLFIRKRAQAGKIEKLCTKYDFDSSKYACNLLGGAGFRGVMPTEYFGTPVLTDFENLKVYGLEKPDLYLKAIYGDYMKLPPEEQRISYHDAYTLDLNKSYLD